MATWQEVKQYIYSNYQVSNDTGDFLTLEFKTTLGRSQLVNLICAEGSPYISVFSPIGPVNSIDGNRLLALSSANDKATGIRQVGDMYVTTGIVLLADLSGPELEFPMRWALLEADQYEQALGLGDRY